MMDEKEKREAGIPTDKDFLVEFRKVEPVKHDSRKGRDSTRYDHGAIHVGELDSIEVSIKNVRACVEDGGIWWVYGDKQPIYITVDGVYADENGDRTEAERQAYYALSYLADRGLVSRWSKK